MSLAYSVNGVDVVAFLSQTCSIGDELGETTGKSNTWTFCRRKKSLATRYVVLLQNDVNLQSLYKEYHLDLNIFVSVAYTYEVFIHNL